MPDRQDIDALMIGALYGELDAAESARLEAHLSSHPEDRAELASLERTRTTLRQGLAEVPSAEPPQAISAVLLQEAARRAPARKAAAVESAGPGLWSRFVTWLRPMAGNPAFAGALALVLVGGAVTTLWLRGGTKSAVPTMSESRGAGAAPQAAAPASEQELDRRGLAADDGRYRVDLDQSAQKDVGGLADGTAAGSGSAAASGDALDLALADPTASPAHAGKNAPGRDVVGMKDAERAGGGKAAKATARADAKAVPTGPGANADKGYLEIAKKDAAPPPRDYAEESAGAGEGGDTATISGAATGGAAVARAPAAEPKPVDPALVEWAKGAHARLVRLVTDGKCPEAGRLGAEIKDRAPEYYAASVANDRAIRGCKQYIEGQAKKKAEKEYKSRSQQNSVDLDEAAK